MAKLEEKTMSQIAARHPAPAFILEQEENEFTRVLVWETEEHAEDDDGAKAIAEYVKVEYVEVEESTIPTGVRFDVPRRHQGQAVEIAYGGLSHIRYEHDDGAEYKRVNNRGLQATAYYKLTR